CTTSGRHIPDGCASPPRAESLIIRRACPLDPRDQGRSVHTGIAEGALFSESPKAAALGILTTGGARHPHVLTCTLRCLRSGVGQPAFARDAFRNSSA